MSGPCAATGFVARGAAGPGLPGWAWVVLLVAFVALAAYGWSRKKR